jgi:hypothetical protein
MSLLPERIPVFASACAALALLSAVPSAQTPADQWAMVVADSTPILRKVENVGDAISSLLWSRVLVSRLPVAGKPQTLVLDVAMVNRPRIKGSGALIPVRVNSSVEKALAFENSLTDPGIALPSRAELCARLGADAGVPAADCAQLATFMLSPTPSSGRLAALIHPTPGAGRLAVFNIAPKSPSHTIPVASFEYRGWFPLDQGYSVIVGEQYRRSGDKTGFALTPIVVTPEGRLAGGAEVEIKTAEPRDGMSRVVESTYRVVREAPLRIVIDHTEEVMDIKSGASKSKSRRATELRWNAKASRFDVTAGK